MPTLTQFCLLKSRRFLSEIADFRRKIVYLRKNSRIFDNRQRDEFRIKN